MPNLWDLLSGRYISRHNRRKQRNLQDGLFQIASQTCNLLVQVNNTNNICYGNGATNIHMNNLHVPNNGTTTSTSPSATSNGKSNGSCLIGIDRTAAAANDEIEESSVLHHPAAEIDREQLLVLIPTSSAVEKKYKPGVLGKPRLSTVLEGPPAISDNDDNNYNWNNGYMQPEGDGSPMRKWGEKNKWCRPSCIPISLICILIFLVVLLPLLDHATDTLEKSKQHNVHDLCINTCSLQLVESIPEGLNYTDNSIKNPSTYESWLSLINSAETSIEIASFYWTLRQSEIYPDPSSIKGENIFQALLRAGIDRKIQIRIAQNAPTQDNPNVDTELLVRRKAAEVRSLNFAKLLGGGVLHTKFWIIDRKHVYIGSANMDWRALTQVKEMGIVLNNCTCLAEDIAKVFEVYWQLGGENAVIPVHWPANLSTNINMESPLNLTLNNETFQAFISSSPPPFNPTGRTNDIDALTNVIKHAEKFVYIAVMDYFPLEIYSPKLKFWPVIDDALKSVAIENKVRVKMLISWWNHSRPAEDYFLQSIGSISESYRGVSIEVKRFIVPSNKEQQKIPFARVNHNKYMVTDNTAYIGTSNWSGDYFIDTAGVAFVLHDPMFDRNLNQTTIRAQLQAVFERDWNSNYSVPLSFHRQ